MASTSLFNTLVILSATLALLTPSFADFIMFSGDTLTAGQTLNMNTYFLVMQRDCNLVLFDMGQSIWSTGTAGKGQNCYLILQYDGNLVIYSGKTPVWSTSTGSWPSNNFVLVLQKDRNLVLYGPAYWSTKTLTAGSATNIATNSTKLPFVVNSDMVSDDNQK